MCRLLGAGFGAAFGFTRLALLPGCAGGGKNTGCTAEEELAERHRWDGSCDASLARWTTSEERTDCRNSPPLSGVGTPGNPFVEALKTRSGPGNGGLCEGPTTGAPTAICGLPSLDGMLGIGNAALSGPGLHSTSPSTVRSRHHEVTRGTESFDTPTYDMANG